MATRPPAPRRQPPIQNQHRGQHDSVLFGKEREGERHRGPGRPSFPEQKPRAQDEAGRKQFAPADDTRHSFGMDRVDQINDHRGQRNHSRPDKTHAEREQQDTIDDVDGKIRESESRSPALPYRVIHGKREYGEWPVDAQILLLCPIR